MSPSLFLRTRVRVLFVILFCVSFLGLSSLWARSQKATSRSEHAARRNFFTRSFLADKEKITPEGNTITVNSLSDVANSSDGLCALREAINAANTNTASGAVAGECPAGTSGGADVITISVTGTIDLTAVLPDITSDMNIVGPGSSQLIVRRNTGGDYRIFFNSGATVTISGITVSDGKTADGSSASAGTVSPDGGGILNQGTLTLTDVALNGNRTGNGGTGSGTNGGASGNGAAIANTANLTMTNCSLTGNIVGTGGAGATSSGAGGNGGGIFTSGPLTLLNCTVTGNQAGTGGTGGNGGNGGHGGGIYSTANSNNLTNVILNNNSAGNGTGIQGQGGNGGGLDIEPPTATTTITNSTIDGNHVGTGPGIGWGGGIYGFGDIIVTGCTVSNNVSARGGGLLFQSGLFKIFNSTVSGNSSPTAAGIGLATLSPVFLTNSTITSNTGSEAVDTGTSAQAILRNTIVAANDPAKADVKSNENFISNGHNLIGNRGSAPGFGGPGDLVGTSGSPINPQLGALADNGGPTRTHALLPISPALDAGDNCVTDAAHCSDANISQLLTDQRGTIFSRIVDGPDVDSTATVDIGAYEMQTPLANLADTSTNEDTQLLVAFNAGDTSTITSVTANSSNPTLVSNDSAHLAAAITGSTGIVTINPATNLSGTTNITVTINRTGGSENKTFLLTVNPVNDAPSFNKGPDQTVNEDAGAQSVSNWATAISPGATDESSQVLTFQITNNTNAALFSAGPAISAAGTLTYTAAANVSGSATITINLKDDGGTANGGVDTSAAQTFTITVNAVNDAPSFTKGADQTVNEDAGAQSVAGWATAISRGPADESGQTLTFQVANNTNAALFSAGPAISSTGTLTYTPSANANGLATITINLKDNGGTANGGVDTSAPQSFTITVNAVNDAPSFTRGANQTVNEDTGAQTVANWATAISAGPADESGQALTFQVTGNTNAALFSASPAISLTGTLTYTPAVNANGSATITINLKDDGGTSNGGVDTSSAQTFTITVNAVNGAPSFTKGADQAVNNSAGAQTVANWATNISAGPGNESSQTVTFQVTGNTNPGLFTAGPAVSSTGTLTYTPTASGGGTATITINLRDNGGTANGGVDTSPSQSFAITVTPVGGFVSFASSSANTTENSGSTTINVVRTGDTSKAVTVNYATNGDPGVPCATASGVASPKCDFTAALGTLNFAAGNTSKNITILISQDSFVEGPENITLTLSNPTGGSALGTPASMSITIADDATEPTTNIIDDANMFVRMHYHDFLNREADQSGLDFWTGQMTNCGAADLTVCRVNVSGAFFLSIEFQQTGYLVERMYKTAYGDATGTSTLGGSHPLPVPIVRFNEFLKDTQRIGQGVVVLQPGWEQALENNKEAYALEFVATSRFITVFPTTMTPAQLVDKLNQNAGNVLSPTEETTAIHLFNGAADSNNATARAQALRQVAEDPDLFTAESNRAFVLAEYIGYLRRNPNDLPDTDYSGYDFWLHKLNQFNGDYITAEMVKAFISASEYRQRFASQ
jgi:CSLREA domain-containing protein